VGAVGNTPAETEELLRPHVDVVGSSARWGVAKPEPAFFRRLVDETGALPEEIAYVGDRVDNDVGPALAAGMVAVHVRRGPWGYLHEPPPQALRVASLDELPGTLDV
jgi:FMN phosphatase YigB (HAD superfamily)